jgi:hypothetical protein
MATINATLADMSLKGDRSAQVVTWTALTEADSAAVLDLGEYEVDAVEFSGTFGGATIVLKGCVLSSGTMTGLTDLGGTAISKTSAGWQTVREQPRYVQPVASGGTSQSLTITLLLRRKATPFRS